MSKRILHIPNYYYPHVGGIEQVANDIVTALGNEQYEHKIICFKDEKKTTIDVVNKVEVIRCGCITKVASQSISLDYKKQLKKVIKEFKPNVVIFHYPNPFVAHFLLKHRKKDFKLILYWHLDITKQKILGKFFHGQTKKLLKWADKIIATSPNYVEGSKYLNEYKYKTEVIPNCVSDNRLIIDENVNNIVSNIKEANEGKKIVFALGRHIEYKGMKYLVEAGQYLNDDYKIYIAGKGPLTEGLMEQAKNNKNIVFLGRVSDDELKAYLKACDIFAFPSITKNEAFGIALAEAMAYAKPAVTFTIDGSGVNYVSINGLTGIEVPNKDSKAFAEAIVKIGEDNQLKEEYGKNSQARFNELFTFKSFKEMITKLLEGYGE